MTDDHNSNVVHLPPRGGDSGSIPEAPDIGGLFYTAPPENIPAATPESPEETTMELPVIPRPMNPEMALRSEVFSTPDIDGEPGEGGDGEYVHRRSLAERLGDWLEYRIALGQARIESEGPFREAEIARKVELLNAKTAREVGLLEQHNKLREAQLKARTDKTAARGKSDAVGAKGSGGKGASGLGADKGGRKNGPQGAAPRQQPKPQQPTKSPAPAPKQQPQKPTAPPKRQPQKQQTPQKQAPAPREQPRKGPGPKEQPRNQTPPKQLPQKQGPAPKPTPQKQAPGPVSKEQPRRDDKNRPKVDLSKGKGGGTKSPGSGADGNGSKGSGSGGRTPPALGSDGAKGGPKAGPGAKGPGGGSKGADGASGRPDGKGAAGSKGSSSGTGPRGKEAPKKGSERPTEGPKSGPGPQGSGGTPKAPGDTAGGPAAGGPGTTNGPGPGPGGASADGPGWPGNRTETPEWPGHETSKQPPPPAGSEDDYVDAVIVGPAALPPAPEPHTARPGTTRPAAQEPHMSKPTTPASTQRGMAAQHRTDVTFDQYLVEIANIALAACADQERAEELAAALGKVADALRDMATDLVGDHNIDTKVTNLISDLADTAHRMKVQAERCAQTCEIAADAARRAAVGVARTYGEDMRAMDDAGLTHASSAAHHD
ncbi:ATP/GTP-binding protein [Streptomyces clavifer]|uniref:ATP/GTP-binding protein n=1 Tax=Streptomyces clavifer TaxID=68188 RepID=UPI0037F14932